MVAVVTTGSHGNHVIWVWFLFQVRSLTLDKMKPEWEDKLKEIGNTKSNLLYEEELPQGFSKGENNNEHFGAVREREREGGRGRERERLC